VSAFLSLLAVVLVLKLWERRDRSDYGQILTMSVFLTIGSTLNNNSFLIGMLLVLQIPLTLLSTMLLHTLTPAMIEHNTLRSQDDAIAHSQIRSPLRTSSSYVARRSQGASKSHFGALAWLALCVMLAATPIIMGIFFLIPRNDIANILGSFGALRRTSGLSDNLNLNSGGLISQSREVIAQVQLSDREGRNLGGLALPQYFRAMVLEQYAEGRWKGIGSNNRVVSVRDDGSAQLARAHQATAAVVRQSVTGVAGGSKILFALAHPVRLEVSPGMFLNESYETGELSTSSISQSLTSYVVESDATARFPVASKRGTKDVSFEEPGVAPIAAAILQEASISPDPAIRPQEEDARAVRAFETFLQTQFTYSLNTPVPASRQVMTWFLTARPAAHCEFFASALAAMCRSVGIDARVIAGYMTSEFDASSSTYTVRSSDAHAWVEAETAPGRWLPFDGTPTSSEEFVATRQGGMFDVFTKWLRNAEGVWNRSVVAFDRSKQSNMWGGAEWLRRVGPQSPAAHDLTQWRRSMRTASMWAMRIALSATVIALSVFLISKLLRTWLPGRARLGVETAFDHDAPMRALYAQVLTTCDKLGAPKPAAVPLRTHILQHPLLASLTALQHATDLLYDRGFARNEGELANPAFTLQAKQLAASLRELAKRPAPVQR
jgi:hypothetical protein